ncbi:hypothetical protein SK128_007051 [Halocaridina rubra]|uniref:glutathione transferase n=1 Tax=Halocaridina rubra TaxID=373956 RepID=A0AAN8X1C3_HALRR
MHRRECYHDIADSPYHEVIKLHLIKDISIPAIMPEYKLIYFDAKGRAELIRWIFAYGKIPYTDERININDWPAIKPTIYSNKVPVLMIDGTPYNESLAIARYFAKKVGLVPEDELLALRVDAGVDTIADKHLEGRPIIRAPISNEEKTKRFREELFPNVLKPFLVDINKQLEGKDWLVGDKVTWLDLHCASFFDNHKVKIPYLLDDFPNVDKHMKRVKELPGIKEWIAKRPFTFI